MHCLCFQAKKKNTRQIASTKGIAKGIAIMSRTSSFDYESAARIKRFCASMLRLRGIRAVCLGQHRWFGFGLDRFDRGGHLFVSTAVNIVNIICLTLFYRGGRPFLHPPHSKDLYYILFLGRSPFFTIRADGER